MKVAFGVEGGRQWAVRQVSQKRRRARVLESPREGPESAPQLIPLRARNSPHRPKPSLDAVLRTR
jgi:hypothetical protein